MSVRKRKRGGTSLDFNIRNALWLGLLGLGLVALMLISVNAMWQWVLEEQAFASPHRTSIPKGAYLNNGPKALGPVKTTAININLADILPEGAQLVISTANGELLSNAENFAKFSALNLNGDQVSVSPDGKSIAYVRDGKLRIYQNGIERVVTVAGNPTKPSWDLTGKTLTFVIHEDIGDSLYRIGVDGSEAVRLMTVPKIVAPVMSHPATGRLVIAEQLDVQKTAFYTIDANCEGQGACEASRREIATVSHAVNWADIHPNAGSIVFSDAKDGNLYLLMTGSGDVTLISTTSGFKQHPLFNADGTWLAYTNVTEGNKLHIVRLKDNQDRVVPLENVNSFDWSN